jgi:predicted AAA+ superfamily ATPase
MKRLSERKLQAWKGSKVRKPLILKGIRQCGKTFLLTDWGQRSFARCHTINFEQSPLAHRIFDRDLSPERLIAEIAFFLDVTISRTDDILILDEIQECPRALTSLKYFHEQLPEMAVAAAGSLLGLALNQGSFPVGKTDMVSIYPLSFCEFLLALGDTKSVDFLSNCSQQTVIPEVVHAHLWERLRWYFVTGGLPEVVLTFLAHLDDLPTAFRAVREKQHQLLYAYSADFAKHSGKQNAMHIERVWRAVPQQLANSQDAAAHRFMFTGVVPGIDRYQRLAGAIDWLSTAQLVLPAAITAHAEIPLMAYCQEKLFKLYACDVGLLGAMAGLPPKVLLSFAEGSYKGYFAENFVAQELTGTGTEPLYCWQEKRAEVEFVRTLDCAVVPVEVKSGQVLRTKSLDKFVDKYKPPYSVIFSGRTLHVEEGRQRHNYPLYLAGQFPLQETSSS